MRKRCTNAGKGKKMITQRESKAKRHFNTTIKDAKDLLSGTKKVNKKILAFYVMWRRHRKTFQKVYERIRRLY